MHNNESMNLKNIIKKYWWLLLILILGIPILIHTFFKIPAPFEFFIPEWDAGIVLLFYATLLGSVALLFGLYQTYYAYYNDRKKQYEEQQEQRLAIMPFLASTFKKFEGYKQQTEKWHEIMCSPTSATNDIPKELKFNEAYDLTLNQTALIMDREVLKRNFERDHYVIEYSFWNCGAGDALKVCLKYNAESFNVDSIPIRLDDFFTLHKNEKRVFVLIFSKEEWLNGKMKKGTAKINEVLIKFSFSYSNADNSSDYKQEELFMFFINESGRLDISQEQYLNNPELIRR